MDTTERIKAVCIILFQLSVVLLALYAFICALGFALLSSHLRGSRRDRSPDTLSSPSTMIHGSWSLTGT